MPQAEILSQSFELGFTYTRSTGPIVGRFLTGLRDRKIVGIRSSEGQVIVPPMEFDPHTAEALSEFVEVGQVGALVSWCWVSQPFDSHPLKEPFGWAMIRLDGADVPMIHCVKAASEAELGNGVRVRAVWAEQTRGYITDIQYFEIVASTSDE